MGVKPWSLFSLVKALTGSFRLSDLIKSVSHQSPNGPTKIKVIKKVTEFYAIDNQLFTNILSCVILKSLTFG